MSSLVFVSRFLRSPATFIVAALAVPLGTPACGPGGCPWVGVSEVDVDPASDCLVLSVPAGTDAEKPAGGCVNPELRGRNECAARLVMDASPDGFWPALVAEPGEEISIVIDLEARTSKAGDRIDFVIPARLGDAAVTIRFATFAPD